MTLTERQEQIVIQALRVAAEVFETDATNIPALAAQFERQAIEARRLADLIEG